MISFKEYFNNYLQIQESFRKSTKVKHLYDVPMFSIFAHNELIWSDQFKHPMDVNIELDTKRVRDVFAEARKWLLFLQMSHHHYSQLLLELLLPSKL